MPEATGPAAGSAGAGGFRVEAASRSGRSGHGRSRHRWARRRRRYLPTGESPSAAESAACPRRPRRSLALRAEGLRWRGGPARSWPTRRPRKWLCGSRRREPPCSVRPIWSESEALRPSAPSGVYSRAASSVAPEEVPVEDQVDLSRSLGDFAIVVARASLKSTGDVQGTISRA